MKDIKEIKDFIKDTKLKILIFAVDNSGSMSRESIKEISAVITELRSDVDQVIVIKHSWEITGVLSLHKKDKNEVSSFLDSRSIGGSSHEAVFAWLDKVRLDKSIFISCSDNYSDIEKKYKDYKNIQEMPKVWINIEGRPVDDDIPGMKIEF